MSGLARAFSIFHLSFSICHRKQSHASNENDSMDSVIRQSMEMENEK
jgi:hypothetical protein